MKHTANIRFGRLYIKVLKVYVYMVGGMMYNLMPDCEVQLFCDEHLLLL